MSREFTIPLMFRFDCAKLNHPATIRAFDFDSVRPIILVSVFCSDCIFSWSSENQVVITMLNDKYRLLDFDSTDVDADIMTDTNRTA